MSDIKTAKRWANRWSKFYTDATNSKIKFYLMPREYGKSSIILRRLRNFKALRALENLAMHKYKHRVKCSRVKIKGRGC